MLGLGLLSQSWQINLAFIAFKSDESKTSSTMIFSITLESPGYLDFLLLRLEFWNFSNLTYLTQLSMSSARSALGMSYFLSKIFFRKFSEKNCATFRSILLFSIIILWAAVLRIKVAFLTNLRQFHKSKSVKATMTQNKKYS